MVVKHTDTATVDYLVVKLHMNLKLCWRVDFCILMVAKCYKD